MLLCVSKHSNSIILVMATINFESARLLNALNGIIQDSRMEGLLLNFIHGGDSDQVGVASLLL